jgi:8-oxo-dGTP pyrophosphatase MutT (NUDIX family)
VIVRPNLDLLLIRRAEREGDPWSGHMAFPGGRHEPDDGDLAETARRETQEEVGLDLSDAPLLGRLDDTLSPSRRKPPHLAISAFVFATPHPAPTLQPNEEVASAYWLGLDRFLSEEGRTTMPFEWKGNDVMLPAVYLEDAHIWGLTLRILDDLATRIRTQAR